MNSIDVNKCCKLYRCDTLCVKLFLVIDDKHQFKYINDSRIHQSGNYQIAMSPMKPIPMWLSFVIVVCVNADKQCMYDAPTQ